MLAAAGPAAAPAPAEAQASASPWHGEYFPNAKLVTQDGKTVRFYDDLIKDRVVVINFMFTSCRDVCPMDTAQMRAVQAALGDRVGKDIFFYSISVDPKTDTPAVLKSYMQTFKVGPGWTFLTGSQADVELLQKKLGVAAVTPASVKDHDTRFIVGNEATGQWMKRSAHEHPQVMADLVGGYLFNGKVKDTKARPSYSNAVQINNQSEGAALFRTRCASCHTLGGGPGLGPDLHGVVNKHPQAWLARWIKEPDKMLAEKDPRAVALAAQWRNLPMPNLKLDDDDAAALIDYLRQETRKTAKPEHTAQAGRQGQ
ncbi:SCO family protein [Caulobacter sp. 17J65-9]|uniref:SCO family protein n=1 Tax=Caulobacter sp. 17J65-9 TaxID=2709382 RepID=UPI0013CA1154|nr:SCO family protein [Caulobacter sp. 17J65-9]NEX94886.1 c-type cytochrome [Caulobacter sp. 17J65-9]